MRPTREAHRAAGRRAPWRLPALAALALAAALATAAAAATPPAPAPKAPAAKTPAPAPKTPAPKPPTPASATKTPAAKTPEPAPKSEAAAEAPAAPDEPVERPGTYYPTGIEPPSLQRPALVAMSVLKVVLLALLAVAVFYVLNWTLLDTRFVDTSVLVWGLVVLGGGMAGLAAAVLVPMFYLGYPLGLVLFGGAAMAYAVHRNALVTPPLKVLTSAHVDRVRRRLRGEASLEGGETGPVSGAGRDIIFVGLDDLPRQPAAASPAERQAGAAVERVLHEAIVRRASVLGYVSRPQKGEVRLRIDGEMVAGEDVPHPASDGFAGVVKQLAGLDPREVRRPQEGRLRAVVGGQTFDLRIKTAGTVRGEQVAVRIIDLKSGQRRLDELGLAGDTLAALKAALGRRPGLVLLSSPKDSGLTTTLHACLRQFDRYVDNVLVFEPHVDIEIENVTHVPLDQEDGPVAVAEVRSRIRMEPDVVAFDSLYQTDVARMLAEAAREHTVIIALRAGDTTQALTRLGALVGSSDVLAASLQAVLNQRLVRLLCPECREAYRPNPEFIRKANLGARRVDVLHRPPTHTAVEGGQVVVCPRCHNDRYVGRTGIFELMPIDDEARDLIARGASVSDLRTYARKLGMRNLQEEGLAQVIAGTTSIEEVLRTIRSA